MFDIAVKRCEALLLTTDQLNLVSHQRNDRRAHGLEPALVGPIRGVLRVNEPPESLRRVPQGLPSSLHIVTRLGVLIGIEADVNHALPPDQPAHETWATEHCATSPSI